MRNEVGPSLSLTVERRCLSGPSVATPNQRPLGAAAVHLSFLISHFSSSLPHEHDVLDDVVVEDEDHECDEGEESGGLDAFLHLQ